MDGAMHTGDSRAPLALHERLLGLLPLAAQRRMLGCRDAARALAGAHGAGVAAALARPLVRGLVLQEAKRSSVTCTRARHSTHFDWAYPSGDAPELERLYQRAKAAQWDAARDLPWDTSVDPESPDAPLLPATFFSFDALAARGVRLSEPERRRFRTAIVTWTLSQFLHGEQAALYAAAQVVEAAPSFDGKMYGATQVVDEARHVEAFQRYLGEKLERRYPVNDNLFVVIDALIGDRRWDVKFLGMQIMVEGLAVSAFGSMHKRTREPLLKELLHRVLQDEARHVQYGLVSLRSHVAQELSPRERDEREDWAFELALLMRDRFYAHELYEEWFEPLIGRREWREVMDAAPGMMEFQRVMFGRLVRNLRHIGLMSPRVAERYVAAGLASRGGPT